MPKKKKISYPIRLTDLQIFRLFVQKCKHRYKENSDKKHNFTSIIIDSGDEDMYSVTFDSKNNDKFTFVNIYSPKRQTYLDLFNVLNPFKVESEPCIDCNHKTERENNE